MSGTNGIMEDDRTAGGTPRRRVTAEQEPIEAQAALIQAAVARLPAIPSWLKFIGGLVLGGGGTFLGGEYLSKADQEKLKQEAAEEARLHDKVERHDEVITKTLPAISEALSGIKTSIAVIESRLPEKKKATR